MEKEILEQKAKTVSYTHLDVYKRQVLIEFVIGVPFNVILDDIDNPEVILIS